MNYKGQLQEYCQNKGINVPEYNTIRLPSPAHEPKFQSTIIIRDKTTTQRSYIGSISSSKKSAESLAALVALKAIEKHVKTSKIVYKGPSVVILVDLENQQKIVDEILEKINLDKSDITIFVYVTENSPLLERDWNNSKIIKRIIPSIRSDAADTFLIFEAGQLSTNPEFKKFVIVSQDHFAKTLEECFNLQSHSSKIQAHMTSKIDKIIEFLQ